MDQITLPDTPRNADGTANVSAPTPRSSDGRPDLGGIWRLDLTAALRRPEKAKEFPDGPVGLDWLMPKDEEIPLLPAAVSLHRARAEQLGKGSPSSSCLPHGVPDAMIFSTMKLVQTARLTIILLEEFNHFRQVFTDGRSLPQNDPKPTWLGYSVGRWEGDALVVETAGFNDKSWMDDTGLPHGEALRTTETFTRRDFGHLDVRVTINDPSFYSRPWTVALPFVLRPDTELLEHICENERSSAHMVGR